MNPKQLAPAPAEAISKPTLEDIVRGLLPEGNQKGVDPALNRTALGQRAEASGKPEHLSKEEIRKRVAAQTPANLKEGEILKNTETADTDTVITAEDRKFLEAQGIVFKNGHLTISPIWTRAVYTDAQGNKMKLPIGKEIPVNKETKSIEFVSRAG